MVVVICLFLRMFINFLCSEYINGMVLYFDVFLVVVGSLVVFCGGFVFVVYSDFEIFKSKKKGLFWCLLLSGLKLCKLEFKSSLVS